MDLSPQATAGWPRAALFDEHEPPRPVEPPLKLCEESAPSAEPFNAEPEAARRFSGRFHAYARSTEEHLQLFVDPPESAEDLPVTDQREAEMGLADAPRAFAGFLESFAEPPEAQARPFLEASEAEPQAPVDLTQAGMNPPPAFEDEPSFHAAVDLTRPSSSSRQPDGEGPGEAAFDQREATADPPQDAIMDHSEDQPMPTAIDQHQASLDQSQAIMDQHQASLDQSQAVMDQHQASLDETQAVVDQQQASLDQLQAVMAQQQASLDESQAVMAQQQASLGQSQAVMDHHQAFLDQSKSAFDYQQTSLYHARAAVGEHQALVDQRDADQDQLQAAADQPVTSSGQRDLAPDRHQPIPTAIDQQQSSLDQSQAIMDQHQASLDQSQAVMDQHQASLDQASLEQARWDQSQSHSPADMNLAHNTAGMTAAAVDRRYATEDPPEPDVDPSHPSMLPASSAAGLQPVAIGRSEEHPVAMDRLSVTTSAGFDRHPGVNGYSMSSVGLPQAAMGLHRVAMDQLHGSAGLPQAMGYHSVGMYRFENSAGFSHHHPINSRPGTLEQFYYAAAAPQHTMPLPGAGGLRPVAAHRSECATGFPHAHAGFHPVDMNQDETASASPPAAVNPSRTDVAEPRQGMSPQPPEDQVPATIGQPPVHVDQHPVRVDQSPAAMDQHPASMDEHPATMDQHPANMDKHPASTMDQHPATMDQHPANMDQHPRTMDQLPATMDQHPATMDQHPGTIDQHPATMDQHSAKIDQHPANMDQHPATMDQHPATMDEPATAADAPYPTTDDSRAGGGPLRIVEDPPEAVPVWSDPLRALPFSLVQRICGLISIADLLALRLVNRGWRAVVADAALWQDADLYLERPGGRTLLLLLFVAGVRQVGGIDLGALNLSDRLKQAVLWTSVRRLRGLECARDPGFSLQLLERAGPRLEALGLLWPGDEELRLAGRMPLLRSLHVGGTLVAVNSLPAQLQELSLGAVEGPTLVAVQGLPALRALDLRLHFGDVEFPALPAGHCGLRALGVYLPRRGPATLVSLLRANAATLEELLLGSGLECNDGAAEDASALLAHCDNAAALVSLRRVVMRRYGVLGSQHPVLACREQLDLVRRSLLRPDLPHRSVDVLCDRCHRGYRSVAA